jgi:hypothetical protein
MAQYLGPGGKLVLLRGKEVGLGNTHDVCE